MVSPPDDAATGPDADEMTLVAALRRGDEMAFVQLLDRYNQPLRRLALVYIDDPAIADEVVQETWLGVLASIHRFQGRARLRTWLFRILTNRAKTRATREARVIPFSALQRRMDADEPAVEPDRFVAEGPAAGFWLRPPRPWEEQPEARLLSRETRDQIALALAALPTNQRLVITLRDVEGWSAAEVCNALEISETNQRVLLHRARSRMRRALERYLATE